MSHVRCIGRDVHAETIAVAVAEPDGAVRSVGVIPNRPESIRTLVKTLGPPAQLRVCDEAGPTGSVVSWQLTALDVACQVVAPTLVPVKPGDRVKTDRRDARKLARRDRAGDVTPVWVPDAAHEALRDRVRARDAAKTDPWRARHRLGKFLLRHGRRPPTAMKAWTQAHLAWVKSAVHVDHAAQEATLLDDLHEVEHGEDEEAVRLVAQIFVERVLRHAESEQGEVAVELAHIDGEAVFRNANRSSSRTGDVNVTPLSVPASHGTSSMRCSSIHWPFWKSGSAETPTNQSGLGATIVTSVTRGTV